MDLRLPHKVRQFGMHPFYSYFCHFAFFVYQYCLFSHSDFSFLLIHKSTCMRRIFTRISRLFLLVFFPGILFAQQKNDYTINLHSGKFIPTENSTSLSKKSATFKKSLFGDVYYVTIQFNELPDQSTKEKLSEAGIQLFDYIPNYAYTSSIPENIELNSLSIFNIRSIFQFTPEQKTVPALLKGEIPAHAIRNLNYVDINVITYNNINAAKINAELAKLDAILLEDAQVFKRFTIRIAKNKLTKLVALPFVQWVEFIDPPNKFENTLGRTLHRVNNLNDGVRNLKGDGINIGIWDGGAIGAHLDFLPADRLTQVEASAVSNHSTHCAGTIMGRGLIDPTARGMAPNAKLFSYNFNGNIQTEMSIGIPTNNLIVSSHSYGSTQTCGVNGAGVTYDNRSRETDINLNNFPFHLHCHSAGNSQTACSGGWSTITASGKSAKNNILVAAVTSSDVMTSFSSFGPVQDGRVKPEISSFGSNVWSTEQNNTYAFNSGTSMATPGVSGSVTLLVQRYKELNAGSLPPSTLIKNTVLNTADDFGNPGPDYKFGYGRINALEAVRILEQNRYILNTITTGATNSTTITVPPGTARLRVMLTWNDPAAAANANPALVNDLNLTVTDGAAAVTLPWILDPNNPGNNATRGNDNFSNIEQVTINNPVSGTYTLKVNGVAIPTGPNQQYALTWSADQPYIEVIYPNGNESFNPFFAETITWNNAGITGNQTIEYSMNNGANWTTVSTTVPATTTRFAFTVPDANTATALVRVSSGAITDISDANFKILGTVTGFTSTAPVGCTSGEVSFTWNAVTNATHYDIYRLDNTTGQFVLLSSNIIGTTFTATALTPGANMWFNIRSKNNTTNSESEKSIAINATVSSGGGGLGAIGIITGQTIVCGTPSGIPYNIAAVSGATTYTWTAPPGASIVNGQGTNAISINYLAGSANGNVTVVAGNGSCSSPSSILAITIGSAAIASPTSGGNQSQIVCPGGIVPLLTASATVSPGHSVVWYNAVIGGSIVTSPILNTAGTVTYHAASRNTSTGCESINRTPVTLTITQITQAAITAAGPITFCQGGSVVLTANTGTSYLWNNGATTQSITVSTSGSFSVAVTNGSCLSISATTNVLVNPIPIASITAGGVTTFCQGLNVLLTASAGNSWLWNNGATTQSITVSTSGNYFVTVTNASGCGATSSTTTITVNSNPPAAISAGGVTTFCQGANVVLTANAGSSYLWSNGATSQAITVNTSGTFTVAVTQSGGCVSNSPARVVTVNPLPAANITAGGATNFCQGSSVGLTASPGSSWLWNTGATTQTITTGTTGNYSVTVTNAAGCFAASTATAVTVSPNPSVSISAAPYTMLFPGLSTSLTANVIPTGSYNYAWFKNGVLVTGATLSTLTGIDLDDLGSYTVTVTNTSGLPCTNTSAPKLIADSASSKLFIYPSPNNGQFKVAYYTPGTNALNRLIIFDSKGSQVFNRTYNLLSPYQLMNVDLRQHGRGIYRVIVFDKAGIKMASGSVVIQ